VWLSEDSRVLSVPSKVFSVWLSRSASPSLKCRQASEKQKSTIQPDAMLATREKSCEPSSEKSFELPLPLSLPLLLSALLLLLLALSLLLSALLLVLLASLLFDSASMFVVYKPAARVVVRSACTRELHLRVRTFYSDSEHNTTKSVKAPSPNTKTPE